MFKSLFGKKKEEVVINSVSTKLGELNGANTMIELAYDANLDYDDIRFNAIIVPTYLLEAMDRMKGHISMDVYVEMCVQLKDAIHDMEGMNDQAQAKLAIKLRGAVNKLYRAAVEGKY